MIKDNQKFLNRLHLVLDMLLFMLSYLEAWTLKFKSSFFVGTQSTLSFRDYMMALIFIVPGYLLLYMAFHLYTAKRVMGRRYEIGELLKANILGVLIFLTVLFVFRQVDFSREMIVIFFVVNCVNGIAMRMLIRLFLRTIRKKGFNQKHILLIGYSRATESFIDRIKANPQWGYLIRGILDDNMERGTTYKEVKVIGRIDNLSVILPENRLDEIAITLGIEEYQNLGKIVAACEKSGVHTKFIPDYNGIIPTKPYTEDLLGLPVINIRYVPLTNTFNAFIKRLMDIIGSLAAIIIALPIMLIVSLLIKATSKGELIFKQERVGLHNKTFNMYKFRSMVVQEVSEEKKEWTTKDDPRVTAIGRFIRKTSIDELPQLFNVLKGDMSLIGPRPERPYFVEKFKEEIPRYMVKHQVRPGLTGWAQVNGYRGDTSIKKRIEYDLYYIENWTIGFDIKIFLMTFLTGFVNKNAY
ncbi:MAG: undecaprenyl-phosphate glucose phosphotransferase [Lachnospiraceae bacterium]|nr:undecaprenyl-phosphate glucose phosphotransferase [Lachnospiraceae bacterium]MDE6698429.1 undecaprenyl-phosphate glucose phosphotransferase [Lachnospiraceae bacterium]